MRDRQWRHVYCVFSIVPSMRDRQWRHVYCVFSIVPSIRDRQWRHVHCVFFIVALLPDSDNRTVLIEGVLFRTRYLGSTKIMSEGNPSKAKRMMQAQEAVGQIKVCHFLELPTIVLSCLI